MKQERTWKLWFSKYLKLKWILEKFKSVNTWDSTKTKEKSYTAQPENKSKEIRIPNIEKLKKVLIFQNSTKTKS